MPKVPTTALSWGDARHILEPLGGPTVPRGWQGSLPFTYHVGPGPVRVKLHLKQDYQLRTIWDVIGTVPGSESADQWIVAGNHRDAWVYGAVDPNSGTTAMLEAVHGVGELLKSGWRPRRTIVFASWDAEEFGLIGSTEWAEQHASELQHAAAYFNTDVAVAGPNFTASAVPSLKQFVRDVTRDVPSPAGGSVFEAWASHREDSPESTHERTHESPRGRLAPAAIPTVGDLGSGSDFTPFLQHLGVPSTDVGSGGDYGVYHSAFDNFAWFKKFADPDFAYEQEMARVFGLEVIRFASADVLPYDYGAYGQEIDGYLKSARQRAADIFGDKAPDFSAAIAAAARLTRAGAARSSTAPDRNHTLIAAERGFLAPRGLPGRPWYHHVVYAPGKYTGYAAAVLPGVNEALDAHDAATTAGQLQVLTDCINRVAAALESLTH